MINFKDDDIREIIDICNKTPFKLNDDNKYKYYHIEPSFSLTPDINISYKIIRKKLNEKSNIPLYVSVGFSNNSFCNNLLILNNNIDKIKDKYKEIIFIKHEDGPESHRLFVKFMKDMKPDTHVYVINDVMKYEMAKHYDKIIRKINEESKYDEIDYLGVSLSGGTGVFLSQMDTIRIRKLILMAPGIYEGFVNIPKDQTIILGWCIQDIKVPFKTDGLKLIEQLKEFNNKIIILTDLDNETNDDITHRLQNSIFDIL